MTEALKCQLIFTLASWKAQAKHFDEQSKNPKLSKRSKQDEFHARYVIMSNCIQQIEEIFKQELKD